MDDKKLQNIIELSNKVFKPNPVWDIKNRQDVNLKIVAILELSSKSWPSMRLGQILSYFNITAQLLEFNVEPILILKAIEQSDGYKQLELSQK